MNFADCARAPAHCEKHRKTSCPADRIIDATQFIFVASPILLIGLARLAPVRPRDSHFRMPDIPNQPLEKEMNALLAAVALSLRSGNTAGRSRRLAVSFAKPLGVEIVAMSASSESVALTLQRADTCLSQLANIGPIAVNLARVVELDGIIKRLPPRCSPCELTEKIDAIGATPSSYSRMTIVGAIGLASGSLAFLNGATPIGILCATLAAGLAQLVRSWLVAIRFNQHGTTLLTALAASSGFAVTVATAQAWGAQVPNQAAGFIASVLFLVPGIPLISGLFDLVQNETVSAVTRFASGLMLLLMIALGLSIVTRFGNIDVGPEVAWALSEPVKLTLRMAASFISAGAFAMLFGASLHSVAVAGAVALAANSARLALIDHGTSVAAGALACSLLIGLISVAAEKRFAISPIALTAAPTVIMIPGVLAFRTVAALDHGRIVEGLESLSVFSLAVGGLALGLAIAHMMTMRLFKL